MTVRPIRLEDFVEVEAMMHALWLSPDPYDFSDESIFVWQRDDGPGLGGFISFSVRAWAEGCESSPVPYIEGWWVAPDLRGSGVGRALVDAVERWCLEHGHHELGSDVEVDNEVSLRAHAALGFEPTLRLQFFRKRLR
jgi:aminoglycoside 6'-N-acetyltransferase I